MALNVPFPAPIDELEHLSFIRAMKDDPRIFPDHARLRVLDPDLSAFGAMPNYLNHPSLYYLAMAAIDRPEAGLEVSVRRLRFANTALSAFAMAIMLLAGAAALPDAGSRLAFGILLVLFPKTSILGGLITNDNLGLLATAIVFAGLLRLLRTQDGRGAVLTGLGLALAGWSKFNIAVMLGFSVGFCILLAILRPPRLAIGKIGLAGAIAAAGIVPTLYNLATLGRPFFVSATHNAVPMAERPELSLLNYFGLFLRQLAAKWPGFEPGNAAQMLVPMVILGLAAIAAWRGSRNIFKSGGVDPSGAVGAGFVLALVPSLLLHAIYGYQAFKAIGDLTTAQTRYYYALWPGIALALAWLFANTAPSRIRVLTVAFVAILMAISSAFFAIPIILAAGGQAALF